MKKHSNLFASHNESIPLTTSKKVQLRNYKKIKHFRNIFKTKSNKVIIKASEGNSSLCSQTEPALSFENQTYNVAKNIKSQLMNKNPKRSPPNQLKI